MVKREVISIRRWLQEGRDRAPVFSEVSNLEISGSFENLPRHPCHPKKRSARSKPPKIRPMGRNIGQIANKALDMPTNRLSAKATPGSPVPANIEIGRASCRERG